MSEFLDVQIFPVQAYLTSDGVQYGDEIDTGEAGVDTVLFEHSFDPPYHGNIEWVYFLIGAEFTSLVNSRETIVWHAQVRTVKRNWVHLFRNSNVYARSTAWKDVRMEGYARASQVSFSRVRFDFRVLFRCATKDGVRGRIKNNTTFRVIWLAETET